MAVSKSSSAIPASLAENHPGSRTGSTAPASAWPTSASGSAPGSARMQNVNLARSPMAAIKFTSSCRWIDRMDEPPLRVLIADDEPLATERLQLLLARAPGVDLVGTASDGEAAVRLATGLEPDVMLLDIAMPGMDGIDVARA